MSLSFGVIFLFYFLSFLFVVSCFILKMFSSCLTLSLLVLLSLLIGCPALISSSRFLLVLSCVFQSLCSSSSVFLCWCHLSFCVLSVFSYTSCLSVSWTFWMFLMTFIHFVLVCLNWINSWFSSCFWTLSSLFDLLNSESEPILVYDGSNWVQTTF